MTVDDPPDRPLFVWDGDCRFCGWWVRRWMSRLPEGAVRSVPFQEVAGRFPEIPESSLRRSAKLILPDGRVLEAAASVFRLLAIGGRGWAWKLYRGLPPFRWIAEAVYGRVARHRSAAEATTRWVWGDDPSPPTFAVGGWLFRLSLGLVYVVAFLSLLVQVDGLVGPQGILPAGELLRAVQEGTASGIEALWRAPTLAWISSGEAALTAMASLGVGAGFLLALGIRPLVFGAAAWVLYLSLTVVGQDFLAYQWDSLLLEAGFLALFIVPAGPATPGGPVSDAGDDGTPGPGSGWADGIRAALFRAPRPGRTAVWLGVWLLLRLMLQSGLAKIAGGDPVWLDLTALSHHFETQPIPNPVAWFAHQLPRWVHRAGTAGALLIEIAVPLLLLLPRRPRHLAVGAVVLLQALIFLTGNYAFFNLLTVAVAFLAVDDQAWRRLLGGLRVGRPLLDELRTPGRVRGRFRGALMVPYAALAVVVGGAQLARTASPGAVPEIVAGPADAVAEAVAPLRLVNGYGLFADMTTTRPEIVLEGRHGDGPWRAYDFRYKPDDPEESPLQVAPHQPRLDWQMWFAALKARRAPDSAPARARYDRWLLRFVAELLRGTPAVTGLLDADSPFRSRPPDAVRARLVEYRFTGWEGWSGGGRWWRRGGAAEMYLPAVRLDPSGLAPAR